MSQVLTTILYDDNPRGIRSISLDNWQGSAFIVPRANLKDFKQRKESNQAGIYILFESENGAYIGQSDNLGGRLSEHDRNKGEAEWDTAVVFLGNLDSTSIRYLEKVTYDSASTAGRYKILNSNTPGGGKYNEAQKIKAEGFFERVRLITGLAGFTIFENPKTERDREVYVFEDVKNKDASGKGTLLSTGEFIVFKDSLARIKERPGLHPGGRALRKRLLDEGVLKVLNEKSYKFTKDYIFASPSAASGVIAGRATNGWVCWKDEKGRTLDEIKRK